MNTAHVHERTVTSPLSTLLPCSNTRSQSLAYLRPTATAGSLLLTDGVSLSRRTQNAYMRWHLRIRTTFGGEVSCDLRWLGRGHLNREELRDQACNEGRFGGRRYPDP